MERFKPMKKPKTPHGILFALANGKFNRGLFNVTNEDKLKNVKRNDYHYFVTTTDKVLHFVTLTKTGIKRYDMPIAKFDWRLLWDKLGDVPVNDEGELEESFEHFEAGEDREDVWTWFEWYFDISIGKEIFEK